MKTLLSYVLNRLHSLEAPILSHREMASFPRREQRALEKSRVLDRAQDADQIPHPHFPSSGRMVAVRPTARGLFAVAGEDDEYFDHIPLVDDDVQQYRVSVPKLIEVIRKQNGIDGVGDTSGVGLISVGQKTVDGYGAIDVYLSLPNHDVRELATRCLSLDRLDGVKKVVVLLPCALSLPVMDRQLLDARRVMLVALSPIADAGSLVVDWESHLIRSPEDRPDGVYPPRTIIVRSREYKCDLNAREMAFLGIALGDEEVELGHIIHRGRDALWKETFSDTKKTRNKVTKFLSRLNQKLVAAKPQFPFFFSLPRGRRSIVRTFDSDKN